MDYIQVIKKIDKYIGDNIDLLQLLYPREFDCKYSNIINLIENGKNLEQLKKEVESFFSIQGMKHEQRINLLKLFDNEKERIKNINIKINNIFELYKDLLRKTKEITGKYQWVNTAKLMHLYNQNIPLFDNNVINFLNYLNVEIEHRIENSFLHILYLYEQINVSKNIPNIIKLNNNIYSNMTIKYINLIKFIDTLMYFINDTKELKKYVSLCEKHG